MTPEQKRIALARKAGLNPFRWRFAQVHENGSDWVYFDTPEAAEQKRDPSMDGEIEQIVHCPDFTGSLDAVATLEGMLTDEEWIDYCAWIVNNSPRNESVKEAYGKARQLRGATPETCTDALIAVWGLEDTK